MSNAYEIATIGPADEQPGPTVGFEPSVRRSLATVDAFTELLALNETIDVTRASIENRFTVTANRVTERAHPTGRVQPQ
jgi:hypothetical protein